ncbi:MAG: phosphotransferase enzyme family protein [Anaerobacillus sp.]|uniref:phosphotransferase enzyme family protein n=1 Tax=Anaerobacillus sp. TaxID=1872506 RepID=UPI00391B910C
MDEIVLAKGAAEFSVDVSTLQLIGGFSDNVFECIRNNEKVILKFYPSSTYKKDSIMAELDWISFLFTSGVNVTEPLYSANGKLLEVIELDHEEKCYVLAFEKAKGRLVNTSDSETWNEKIFYKLGQTLGKIHSLSKKYQPTQNIKKQDWNMGFLFSKPLDHISEGVVAKWKRFMEELSKLPTDTDDYGMIHNDLHQGNFYLYNNEIILFDFGDCEYNWFIYDIAIVLYHAVQSIAETKGRENFASIFINSFLQGYQEENKLENYWLTKLPFFLNYRQIYSYIYFETFLNEDQKNNEKIKQLLNAMRKRIESDTPYLNLEYEDFT